MGPKLFKVPSYFPLIYWICWFDILIDMWGLLATSYAPITANDNLENKPHLFWGLLANLSALLIPVDSRSIILGVFDSFSP